MKTKIQSTTLIAYFGEILPDLGRRQAEVLEAFLKKENFTNAELAHFMGRPINTIVPRVFELRQKDLVEEEKIRICAVTGQKAKAWKIKTIRQVPSATTPDKSYSVVDHQTGYSCDCPRFRFTGMCAHIKKVAREMNSKFQPKLL